MIVTRFSLFQIKIPDAAETGDPVQFTSLDLRLSYYLILKEMFPYQRASNPFLASFQRNLRHLPLAQRCAFRNRPILLSLP
jgi:hypothetical protein